MAVSVYYDRSGRCYGRHRIVKVCFQRKPKEAEKMRTIAGYRSVIGRGMRSEKIRTYNFPQDRVTDHRLGKSWGNLEVIVDGNLDKVLELTKTLQ